MKKHVRFIEAKKQLKAAGWTHVLSVMADDAHKPGVENFGSLFKKDGIEFWLNVKTIDRLSALLNPEQPAATPLPRPRYFNVAAITTDSRTITSQVWSADPAEADALLRKWFTPAEEKWHGQIALGSIHDMQTKQTTYYRRDGVGLLRLDAI